MAAGEAEALGLPERATLVVLAASGGRLSAAVLAARHGLVLRKPQRERLVGAGLVAVAKEGRSVALALTDRGWDTLGDRVAATPAPRGAGSGGKALVLLLGALAARGVALRDLLADPPVAAAPAADDRTPADVADRVVRAYAGLAPEAGGWVPLTALREALAPLGRAEVDAALRALARVRRATLTLEENQSRLTAADRAAALAVGPDAMHYLSIP
jgi:hypothetical protein